MSCENVILAARDERNGCVRTIYNRKCKTGNPYKTGDRRAKHWIDGTLASVVAKKHKIPVLILDQRIKRGWDILDAATKPVRKYKRETNE